MMDYDSSDDEMATRFEGISSVKDSSLPLEGAAAAVAPEEVEQQHVSGAAATRKTQRPTEPASTRKRRHPNYEEEEDDDDDDDDYDYHDDDERTQHSADASAAAAEKLRNRSKAPHRDIGQDQPNKTNQNNIHGKKRPYCSSASCRKCGRFDFTTETGAKRHEAACDGTKNPKGPWKCPTCGRDSFLTSQAFGGHYRCCNKVKQAGGVGVTRTLFSLGRGSSSNHDRDDSGSQSSLVLEGARLKLSDYNQLVLECIELFEASQSDVNVQVTGNGKRHITVGNVGIRCVHCARNNVLPIGSITYTSDLKTLPHAMYVMVQRHLLVTCAHISNDMKRQLRETKKNSTSQSCTKGAMGLPAYLRLFAETCGLTDDDKKLGVRLIGGSAVTTEASAALRAGEISAPTVTAAPSDGTSSVATGSQIPSHSNPLEDGSINLEMGQDQLPIGETGPNHQRYYNPHYSSLLEEVGEEVEI